MTTLGIVTIIAVLLALAAAAVAIFYNVRYKKILHKLFMETGHEDFGQVLVTHQRMLRRGEEQAKHLHERLKALEEESQFWIRHVGLVKYNPFADSGGNMSFSLAMLDNNGNGAVITSLHSRDGMRMYSKTIKALECDQMLTEEEQQAINKARA